MFVRSVCASALVLALSVFLSMFIVYGKKYLALHIIAGSVAFSLIVGHPAVAGWVMLFLMFCAFIVGISGW